MKGIVCGDPRVDNILDRKNDLIQLSHLLQFKNNQTIITIGSCWDEDLDKILTATTYLVKKHKDIKIIIAPHIPASAINHRITKAFLRVGNLTILYSNLRNVPPNLIKKTRILLLDEIGTLFNAYACSDIVFVGGGFGVGLHNILEPAAFKLPILFGNLSYHKFQEAYDLLASASVLTVKNKKNYANTIEKLLSNTGLSEQMGEKNLLYLEKSQGATNAIVSTIISHIL